MLPSVHRDILEVVADAPGPIRAKQIVPRIGLPAHAQHGLPALSGLRSRIEAFVAWASSLALRLGRHSCARAADADEAMNPAVVEPAVSRTGPTTVTSWPRRVPR
ncbi:hypothetical protein [Streptomyces sp. NPDC007905]|uniref:hypothetical protein n=1 Tax=Streptomyces sp. NPDC007905 TaxID=3364788 RepID=UPI0036EC1E6D